MPRHKSAESAPRETDGSVLVLSFHAIKCLTTGEGGMALSDDPDVLEKMRRLRVGVEAATVARVGSPMTDLQAALGLSRLDKYDRFLQRRRAIAGRYFDALADMPVQLPHSIRDRTIFFRFPVKIRGYFDVYRQRFHALGVQVRRGVDALLHRTLAAGDGEFAGAESLFRETLSIPLYPALADCEIETVIAASWRSQLSLKTMPGSVPPRSFCPALSSAAAPSSEPVPSSPTASPQPPSSSACQQRKCGESRKSHPKAS